MGKRMVVIPTEQILSQNTGVGSRIRPGPATYIPEPPEPIVDNPFTNLQDAVTATMNMPTPQVTPDAPSVPDRVFEIDLGLQITTIKVFLKIPKTLVNGDIFVDNTKNPLSMMQYSQPLGIWNNLIEATQATLLSALRDIILAFPNTSFYTRIGI